MCIDFRALNDITIKDKYPLPLYTTMMNWFQKAKFFTKLDLKNGYHNIQMKKSHEWKAAFRCYLGQFEPTVLWKGLSNGFPVFQRFMN